MNKLNWLTRTQVENFENEKEMAGCLDHKWHSLAAAICAASFLFHVKTYF